MIPIALYVLPVEIFVQVALDLKLILKTINANPVRQIAFDVQMLLIALYVHQVTI